MENRLLIYRYNSICEPAIIRAFQAIGLIVDEITAEMNDKSISAEQCLNLINAALLKKHYLAVFTVNFYPIISEVCQIHKIPYISWTVDCPVMELYSDSIFNSCNRIFMFDYAQYQEFNAKSPSNTFYLPLAADVEIYDETIKNTFSEEIQKTYVCDVSFVGSLYSEKCSYNQVSPSLPDKLRGYLDGIMDAQSKVYAYNFLNELLTEDIAIEYEKYGPTYKFLQRYEHNHISALSNNVLAYKIAEIERTRLLKLLSENFDLKLFTMSDTSHLPKAHNMGAINTYTQMPHVFHNSKINLNFTIKAIQTGLPLRIWDIMGCGGFVLSNYQQEIPEYFNIGVDLETFGSENELIDKVSYYLLHDDEREAIALNGYKKVKSYHNWINRCIEILKHI